MGKLWSFVNNKTLNHLFVTNNNIDNEECDEDYNIDVFKLSPSGFVFIILILYDYYYTYYQCVFL